MVSVIAQRIFIYILFKMLQTLIDIFSTLLEGLLKWPPDMDLDIAEYLLSKFQKTPLTKRLLSDCKEKKAYFYFDNNFLDQAFNKLTFL